MSVVYFIAGGTCIKIGISKNLKSRFASLQTSSGEDLRILGTIPGGAELERKIHDQLGKYRKRGEWFLDCVEVRRAIVELCGRDVFEVIEEPPQPSPPRAVSDILDDMFELTKLRFSKFFNFCLEDSETNKGAKIWRLHVTKRHLIIAAIQYAFHAIEREEEILALNPEDIEAAGRAAASAECCECHVEMVVGRDDAWFLDGWTPEPRANPLFETVDGKSRWKTVAEAKASGWVPPENMFSELIRAA